MKEQLLDDATVEKVLKKHLSLKMLHFDHLAGAPTQVVSQLMLAAYGDNFDYFYQVPPCKVQTVIYYCYYCHYCHSTVTTTVTVLSSRWFLISFVVSLSSAEFSSCTS